MGTAHGVLRDVQINYEITPMTINAHGVLRGIQLRCKNNEKMDMD